MTQYLGQRVIKLFLDKGLIQERFAQNLLRWRHSGFSIDHKATRGRRPIEVFEHAD